MTVDERRKRLLEWMRAHREPATTDALRVGSRLYLSPKRSADQQAWRLRAFGRCQADLYVLEGQGLVRRLPGRPARWEAT